MSQAINRFPFAHTFSIVARDPENGEMGVAVQSHWFSVGSVVAWGAPGVGVVATQATAEKGYGPRGLALMQAGVPAGVALAALLQADENREVRQVAMLDRTGEISVHTGKRCIAWAGHVAGDGFSVQANMMRTLDVWPAMAEAFRTTKGALEERMLVALEAAQAAGGDIRGQQSACMLVVSGEVTDRPWDGIRVDLRVEDHPRPLQELRRLLKVQRAYDWMNQGDAYLADGRVEEALAAYRSAAELAPEFDELPFWHALTLAELGRVDEADPIFKAVFEANQDWAELVRRLPAAGLLKEDPMLLHRILSNLPGAPAPSA